MRTLNYVVLTFAILLAGCPLSQPAVQPKAEREASAENLNDLVASTLEKNLASRQLSSETHGAWQVMHGILAYGDRFQIETDSQPQSALEYLLAGKPLAGFEPVRGDIFSADTDSSPNRARLGMRVEMQPGTKVGQGHRDQWLAVVSQCDLPLETPIHIGDHVFTIDDWLKQTEYDLPRNLELEFSWSLIALAVYRQSDYRWTARDGIDYSVEELIDAELSQDIASSVCGGTHRLIGVAMALEKRREEGGPIDGVWREAEATIEAAIELAKQNQNADGSYSTSYLHRSGWSRDLGESLGTTGHVLELLAIAAPDEVLAEPWVERTVRRVCTILDQCQDVDLECGVLYHALHGLDEYLSRSTSTPRPIPASR